MIYALVLTVLLGFSGQTVPLTTEINFKTEKECVQALQTAGFHTSLPWVSSSATCEKRPTT